MALCFALNVSAANFVVIIDAGHGGHDPGAVGRKAKEKDINLGVALKLGDLIKSNMKDVDIVYTRNNDSFVTLQGRADIANKAAGDLFISIHTNSVDSKSKNRSTAAGASVYTLGFKRSEENLAVAMRENSVMTLEADYTTTYQGFDPSSAESYIIFEMSQNLHMDQSIQAASELQKQLINTAGRESRGVRQANFWVLLKTAMPAVLVELDFISNPTCESFLQSEKGQKLLAKALYNGFASYKASVDRLKDGTSSTPVAAAPQTTKPEPVVQNSSQTLFMIQFLTAPRRLDNGSDAFKGLSPVDFYVENGTYKYTYGQFYSLDDANKALPAVRKKFRDAFIIKMVNGKRAK